MFVEDNFNLHTGIRLIWKKVVFFCETGYPRTTVETNTLKYWDLSQHIFFNFINDYKTLILFYNFFKYLYI